jgi:hypothetical protein
LASALFALSIGTARKHPVKNTSNASGTAQMTSDRRRNRGMATVYLSPHVLADVGGLHGAPGTHESAGTWRLAISPPVAPSSISRTTFIRSFLVLTADSRAFELALGSVNGAHARLEEEIEGIELAPAKNPKKKREKSGKRRKLLLYGVLSLNR